MPEIRLASARTKYAQRSGAHGHRYSEAFSQAEKAPRPSPINGRRGSSTKRESVHSEFSREAAKGGAQEGALLGVHPIRKSD